MLAALVAPHDNCVVVHCDAHDEPGVYVPVSVARNRPSPSTMSPYELAMLLIAHLAWLSRVSLVPQLVAPAPVVLSIELEVSRMRNTYGLSGSPAYAGALLVAMSESAASAVACGHPRNELMPAS
jgi:hypothetical protein